MRSEYSLVHFAELEFQWYNEAYMPFKCDLHDSSSMLKWPKQKYDLGKFEENRPTICVACYQMNTRYQECANDNGDDSKDTYNDDVKIVAM